MDKDKSRLGHVHRHVSFLLIIISALCHRLYQSFSIFFLLSIFFIAIAFRVICHIEGDHQIFAEGINTNFII